MLERTMVFVDTSYLLASFYNSWETGARAQLEIDLPEVVCVLGSMVEAQLNQPIQRQNWYDGIPDSGPHRYQRALRTCTGVQLRAGQLIEWGERRTQKAVDTRLVADMVLAAVRAQCSDMVLVSGDADMIPGVQEAAACGVRVHLYGFGWDSMSSALRHACDSTTILDPREDFADSMQIEVLEGPLPPSVPAKPVGITEEPEEPGPKLIPESVVLHSSPITEGDGTSATPPATAPATPTAAAPEPPKNGTFAADSLTQHEVAEAAAGGDRPTDEAALRRAAENAACDAAEQERFEDRAAPAPCDPDLPDSADMEAQSPEMKEDLPDSAPEILPDPDPLGGESSSEDDSQLADLPKPAPKPSMMAPKRKLRSRYVPLPNEVWSSAGFQTPFEVGQQYAAWWYEHAASPDQRDNAHLLSGGGLPPEVDRPLLQFACETLHEYTLTETQRVNLRDGFHSGIRGVLINIRNEH